MELKKNNFTKRYFNDSIGQQYNSSLKNQIDMINTPTASDAMADSYAQMANQPAQGEEQRASNAFMAGMAGSAKARANAERQEKLSPLMQQVADLNSMSAVLQSQMQQGESARIQGQEFVVKNAQLFNNFSNATLAGAQEDADKIGGAILNAYRQISGDENIGNLDHTHQGNIFYTDNSDNTIKSINAGTMITSLSEDPYAAFGEDAERVLAPFSVGFSDNYKLKQQQIEAGQAKIENTQADTELKNANVGKIEAEAKAEKPKYDDKTLSHIRKANTDWVNDLNKKHKDANKAIDAQTKMRDAIKAEVDTGSWGVGSSTFAKAIRWAREKSGDNKTQQLIELARQPLFKDLKNTFGARITDVDLAMWMTTQADLSNDPALAIEVLDQRINESKADIKEELIRRKILENEFQNGEPYNSLLVDERVQEELGTQQQQPQKSTTVANKQNNFDFKPN